MVDHLKQTDINARRINNVEVCFGSTGRPLQHFDRVLIGEGVLMKMCRKKAKPRQFFLFNDILVYGSILISKRRYSKQRIIPLEDVKIENVEDEGESKYGFLIKTRIKSFMVFAISESEKEQWMSHIVKCVNNVLKKGKQAAQDHAAVWVPDSEAEFCMVCHSTHFTMIQRRHHCRSCGKVVCGACSSRTFTLEGISKKPVRVCDICYNKLCQGFSASPQALNDSSDSEEDTMTLGHEKATFYHDKDEPENLV
ncbi:unnamed protein product [Bursaphelenchus okinawaensis]|uniref:FYVE-type domain-containing protein n=1 Tax=Bursaphelenchus okinawaensis TaxID=465554 RepID=A0A811KTS1_9BILA|nr:unnamed protein product [Bursaphelenchus okinawaensis]CAG9112263.1 unnamed protein product [Bursaphelenchus okinawaensis]